MLCVFERYPLFFSKSKLPFFSKVQHIFFPNAQFGFPRVIIQGENPNICTLQPRYLFLL